VLLKDVTHVEGFVDPVRDMEIINDELRLKDITRAQSIFADLDGKLKRAGGKAPKELKFEHETLQKVLSMTDLRVCLLSS